MEDGPPIFRQDITCPALLDFTLDEASVTGLSPCIAKLSSLFTYFTECLRANPGSLAATTGISVDFFSSGYLDVSVPPVCSVNLCIQLTVTAYAVGFPHSEIADSNGSYCLICAYRKLVRPSSPLTARHPPCTLSHLTIQPEGVSGCCLNNLSCLAFNLHECETDFAGLKFEQDRSLIRYQAHLNVLLVFIFR